MENIFVELDRYDLISLVISTNGPGDYNTLMFDRYGTLNGFPNEKWEWNIQTLESLTNEQLFILYKQLKAHKTGG